MRIVRRILYVIGTASHGRMLWVLALAIAVSILDFVTIGGLLPLLSGAVTPDAATGMVIARMFQRIGLPASLVPSTTALASVLLILFVVKALLTAYSFHEGFRFTYEVQVSIATRMLQGLFARDYEYFLSQNSAVLLKNLTTEVQYFAGSVVLSAFYVVTQGLVIITIGVLLAVVSPSVALAAFMVVGSLTVVMYLLVSRRLTRWGKLREERLSDLNRIAHEALAGIKALKANAAETSYLGRFEAIGLEYARLNTRYQSAGAIPPVAIELLLFGGATVVVLVVASTHASLAGVVPLLGVLGAAAYRILPAAKNLFAYVVNIRYYGTTIRVLEDTLRGADCAISEHEHGEPGRNGLSLAPLQKAIRLSGVSYRYPLSGREALRKITLEIEAGSHVAVVGTSGSGKTTLIDIVLGLLQPSDGAVSIDGVPVDRKNVASWREQLGYVSQHIFLVDGSLRENIAFGVPPEAVDDARVAEVLGQAHLMDLVSRLPNGVDAQVGENGARLSGGERQRLGIARALYRRPRVLVLDEATSALDSVTERAVNTEVLRACEGITVIIIAHRLSTVRHCDKLVIMRDGTVRAIGRYDELLSNDAEFSAMHAQEVA